MTVVATFSGSATEWDDFARGQPGWTPCHRYGWKGVVERVFGHECPYLEARDERGSLVGVLPLVRVRSRLFGHYLVSMPFLNSGGPLGSAEAVAHLTTRAAELASEAGVQLVQLRSRGELPIDWPVSHRKVSVVLDLPRGEPDELWRRFPGKLRSQVRRPQKEGIVVRFGAEEVAGFYEVFARHMRDLGTPTLPRRFFDAVVDAFPAESWFACAYHAGRPVAGGCGLVGAGEVEITWAASARAVSRLAPNMLLYWSFMERAVEHGLERFDFGRCTPGGGTHAFKLQWSSREVPLWWYERSSGRLRGTPSPQDGRYALGVRLWKRLPVPIATALGPRIVRAIP
jgi:FemAB-related protein (PEP-CTERM system-associated)